MFKFVGLWLILNIINLSKAELKSCLEKHKKVEICFKDKEGYSRPISDGKRMVLNTMFYLKAITEVDENRNSISIQAELWSYWADPGLGLSNNSTE